MWLKLFLLCGLACSVSTLRAAELTKEEAVQRLTQRGLTRVSDFWCHADEVRLRTAIEGLDKLERRCKMGQFVVDSLISFNESLGRELNQTQAAIPKAQAAANALPAGSPQRKQADEEVQQLNARLQSLKQQYIDPKKLGNDPPLKPALLEWNAARQELWLSVRTIQSIANGLDESYRDLRNDSDVKGALAAIGGSQRLGPVRGYESELRRATRDEALALPSRVSLLRDGNHFRVGAIVNEQTPATFTVRENSGPTVLPASLVESAGVSAANPPQTAKYRVGNGRELEVQVTRLPYLRIGKWVASDVEVYLLPPEAEDQGAVLGREVVDRLKLRLDPQTLQLKPQ